MSETEIQTARLLLRPVTPQDSGPFTNAVNDPRIYLMLASVPPAQTKAQTLAWIATHDRARQEGTGYFYAITTHKGGLCGIISATRPDIGEPLEIGYWLMPEYWGKGLCTEAGTGLIGWLEVSRNTRVLVAGHFADNPASGRILTKLGFLPCSRRPMFSKGRGTMSDHIMMARIA
ncbi:MAG: GNAT family N-acetyltransferase [Hyphomonas sp.]|uniref:GNAT family N-acetyltransferase n=1 Tax=Hyphomonas sp. TaxID=87 RepID=UPI00349FF0F0